MPNSPLHRRRWLQSATGLLAASTGLQAQAVEKPQLTLAVGGKNLLYYLPLTIAEQKGYFKAEGLDYEFRQSFKGKDLSAAHKTPDKVGAYQLCQAMNRTADYYRKSPAAASAPPPHPTPPPPTLE